MLHFGDGLLEIVMPSRTNAVRFCQLSFLPTSLQGCYLQAPQHRYWGERYVFEKYEFITKKTHVFKLNYFTTEYVHKPKMLIESQIRNLKMHPCHQKLKVRISNTECSSNISKLT